METLGFKRQKCDENINPLTRLSYFELQSLQSVITYFGKFKSPETCKPRVLPLEEDKIFSTEITKENFYEFCQNLKQQKIGLSDTLGWLFNSKLNYDNPEIINIILIHLNTLRVHHIGEITDNDSQVFLYSNYDPMPMPVFCRGSSAPGIAFDVTLILRNKQIGKLFTTSSQRRENNIRLIFGREFIDVLEVGLPGYILGAGEHLELKERDEINKLKEKYSGNPIEIGGSKMISRAIQEEIGNIGEIVPRTFYLGESNDSGRDIRYWRGANGFGYERNSSSSIIVIIAEFTKTSSQISSHTDTTEITNSKFVKLSKAIKEFGTAKMPAAFQCHVDQFARVVDFIQSI